MQTFGLNNDYDLQLDPNSGLLLLSQDANSIQQMIICALKLFIGEYEYNENIGISWVIAMQNGYTQIPLLQYQIERSIFGLNSYILQNSFKITKIVNVNTTFNNNRQLIITATILLGNGSVIGISTNV